MGEQGVCRKIGLNCIIYNYLTVRLQTRRVFYKSDSQEAAKLTVARRKRG